MRSNPEDGITVPAGVAAPDTSKCFYCGKSLAGELAFRMVDDVQTVGDNTEVTSVAACFACRPIEHVVPEVPDNTKNKYDGGAD